MLPSEAATLLVTTLFDDGLVVDAGGAVVVVVVVDETLFIDFDLRSLLILPTSAPNEVTFGVVLGFACCWRGCWLAEIGVGVVDDGGGGGGVMVI